MRGKKTLSERHVKSLRKLVEGNELHELLLNLGVDLMLRASDLLNLKVSDVLNESGSVKKEVRVKMKSFLSLPTKYFLITSVEFLESGRLRVVFPVFFILTLTSLFTVPDSFRTSDTLRFNKSEPLNIKSTKRFKSSS